MSFILIMWKADTVTAFLCQFVRTCYGHFGQDCFKLSDIMSNPVVLECQGLADYIDINFVWMFQQLAYFRV